jgi:modulator of FtsH protease HflK
VRRQLKQEFGFATEGRTDESQATSSAEQIEEKSMVTGDLNAALVEWVIQYRINDPKDFLFSVRNPKETLRDVSESVMREVVGDRTVDEVITIGRQEIESEALTKLRDIVLKYKMGLGIDQVQLKDVNPPRPVQPSFDEVNNAKQQREEQINVATGEYYKQVPKAKGEADQKIRAAEGYASKRINEAQGDVARFNAILAEYLKAPDVTKRRIYLETMTKVMPQLGSKIIIDEEAKQILPLLNLSNGGKN